MFNLLTLLFRNTTNDDIKDIKIRYLIGRTGSL